LQSPMSSSSKQATLDKYFTRPGMAVKKKGNAQIEGQSVECLHDNKGEDNDSIESLTPLSSPLKDSKEKDKEAEVSGKKRKADRSELALSSTRQSPRLQAQRSRLKPKSSLSVVLSPPLTRHGAGLIDTAHTTPPQSLSPSLQFVARPSHMESSASAPTPSYHTALSYPVDASPDPPLSPKASMSRPGVDLTPEKPKSFDEKEIPSSIPWENTPSDGYGDTWPSSQSDRTSEQSSQAKTAIHDTQPRYDEGFRVPDPPLRTGSTSESQSSRPNSRSSATALLQNSPSKRSPQRTQNILFRSPRLASSPTIDLDETQDLTQDDSPLNAHASARKRKRESSITEIPDSVPTETSFSQLQINDPPHLLALEDSVVLLSQPPPSMRKKTPEVITIHSTQSQSQEYISPPGPRPTSQSLSQPFARIYSVDSDTASVHLAHHNWASSQPTQTPVDAVTELSPMANPPSQMPLSSQNDLSKVPEPLGMTLAYGLPRRRSYENMPDLDKLEKEQEKELQQWEAAYQLKHRRV